MRSNPRKRNDLGIVGSLIAGPSTLLFLSPIWDKEKRGGREERTSAAYC